jgi:hypothetical protein
VNVEIVYVAGDVVVGKGVIGVGGDVGMRVGRIEVGEGVKSALSPFPLVSPVRARIIIAMAMTITMPPIARFPGSHDFLLTLPVPRIATTSAACALSPRVICATSSAPRLSLGTTSTAMGMPRTASRLGVCGFTMLLE